jgi:hypothetical protein
LPVVQGLPGVALVDLWWAVPGLPNPVALVVATAALCVFAGGFSLLVRVWVAANG